MENFIKIIEVLIGEKKVRLIRYLLAKSDAQGFIFITISELCETLNLSKPTVIATLKMLESKRLISRVKNGLYQLNLPS